jgi:hypothetical protein
VVNMIGSQSNAPTLRGAVQRRERWFLSRQKEGGPWRSS